MLINKRKIIRFFCKPKLDKEALEAYFHKLPSEIDINWFRDGKYIIGKIEADGYKFMTQAVSAKEFVEMVNDALFTVYKIPEDYFDALEKRRFYPTKEQFEKLNDASVKKSQANFIKEVELARV